MIRKHSRLLSFVLTLLMVFTLIPSLPASAAVAQFMFPFADTQANATLSPVNVGTINFSGTYSLTVPTNLTLKVQQQIQGADGNWYDEGVPMQMTNATPVISGPSRQEFTIMNVQLFNGMNKITVTTPDSVEGTCYVYFVNAPAIYEITLSGQQKLTGQNEVLVDDPNQFYIIKTANATSVTVNGLVATKYSQDAFSLSNLTLKPGRNTLTFVASNDTDTVTITRSIVYVNGPGALSGTSFADSPADPNAVLVDGGGIIAPKAPATELPHGLKGTIYLPANANNNSDPTFRTLDIVKDGTTAVITQLNQAELAAATTYTYVGNDGQGHAIWNYYIDRTALEAKALADFPIRNNGNYLVSLTGDYLASGGGIGSFAASNASVAFTFKNNSQPYISNVQQLYGVSGAGTGGTAGPIQSNITNLPIYLKVNVANKATQGALTLGMSVLQNGVSTVVPAVITDPDPDDANAIRVRIDSLPYIGDMQADFTLGSDRYSTSLKYIPTPAINVYKIYDGMNLDTPDLPAFDMQMMNFQPADLDTIKLTVNGVDKAALLPPTPRSATTFNVAAMNGVLQQGANVVKMEATVNGIPLTKILTIYYFSSAKPTFTNPYPVPVTLPALPEASRPINDTGNLFQRSASGNSYNTTEKLADILFSVKDGDKIVLMLDGQQMATIDVDAMGNPLSGASSIHLDPNYAAKGIRLEVASGIANHFRISNLPLNMGTNSLVVKGLRGPVSQFVPLEIVRSIPPYQVLSPKMPEERVVNQNFVPVVIRAEGADQVLLGKDAMTKTMINGIEHFTYEVTNLKQGSNIIKYTVVRGQQKTNDQFEVYYANTNTVGAQYKGTIGTNASIKAFNNTVQLTFPKGTMLTPFNDPRTKVELFDKQKILLGIADRIDGRTQKTFNALGSIQQIDGNNDYMKSVIAVPAHFGYASDLYWIDAGFYDTYEPGYIQQNGMHPYYGVEANYNVTPPRYDKFNVWRRGAGDAWLKPTSRGTLTLQYDAAIRDQAANRISIWRYGLRDTGFMGWENLGGKVDTSKHTVTASFDDFGYFAVFLNTYGFDDSESHAFARDDIELLYARGIMNSKSTSEFGAYEPTTRGEFATMMVKALDLPLTYDPNNILFLDVPHSLYVSNYWDWRYIETAGQKGIARGVGTRQFAPDERLTREQAATMIALAMNLKLNSDLEKAKANLDKTFADGSSVSIYARAAVEAVYKEKLMLGRSVQNPDPKGKPFLNFDPGANITRAETAKVVANMMRKYKRL